MSQLRTGSTVYEINLYTKQYESHYWYFNFTDVEILTEITKHLGPGNWLDAEGGWHNVIRPKLLAMGVQLELHEPSITDKKYTHWNFEYKGPSIDLGCFLGWDESETAARIHCVMFLYMLGVKKDESNIRASPTRVPRFGRPAG